MWVLSEAPRQPEEEKKYAGTIRDMRAASSHHHIFNSVLSLSPKGDTQWVYRVGLDVCFCKSK